MKALTTSFKSIYIVILCNFRVNLHFMFVVKAYVYEYFHSRGGDMLSNILTKSQVIFFCGVYIQFKFLTLRGQEALFKYSIQCPYFHTHTPLSVF